MMDEDCDWKPDIVKLESELILSDDEECSAGPSQEFSCKAASTPTPRPNAVYIENNDFNSFNDFSSGTIIKLKDDFMLDSVPSVKVENTEDGVPSTDPLLDYTIQGSLPTVPPHFLDMNSCFSGERISIKAENDLAEDPLLDSRWHLVPQINSSASSSGSAGFPLEGVTVKQENASQYEIPQNDLYKLDTMDFCDGPRIAVNSALKMHSASCIDVVSSMSVDPSTSVESDIVNYSNDCLYNVEGGDGSSQKLEPTLLHSDKCSASPGTELRMLTQSRKVGIAKKFACINGPGQFILKNNLKQRVRIHSGEQSFAYKMNTKEIQQDKHPTKHLKSLAHDRPFPCKHCLVHCKSKSKLKEHLLVHSHEKPFSCHECSVRFKSKRNLNRHLTRNHSNARPFSCDQCSACFKSKGNLKGHFIRKHSDARPFACDQCSGCFKSKKELNRHLIHKHSDEKSFSCDQCSACFKYKEELNRHIFRKHCDARPFSCDQCFGCFKSKTELNRHLIHKHSDQKYFSCDQCSAWFKSKQEVNKHLLRKHSDEKSFSCDQCSACFKSKQEVNKHLLRKHSDERPFSCDQCSAYFKFKGDLNRHFLHKHSDERPFPCDQCSACFKSKGELNSHLIRKHSDERPFSCDQCSAYFKFKGDLNRHFLHKHSDERLFPCDQCTVCC